MLTTIFGIHAQLLEFSASDNDQKAALTADEPVIVRRKMGVDAEATERTDLYDRARGIFQRARRPLAVRASII